MAMAHAMQLEPFLNDLRSFMERTGLGYTDLSRGTGYSLSHIKDVVLAVKRPSAGLMGQLRSFMVDYETKGVPQLVRDNSGAVVTDTASSTHCDLPDGFLMTRCARTVVDALNYCAQRRLNGAIFGDPGVGKSAAMQYWSATTKHPHAVVFCRAYTSHLRLLMSIARSLGMPPSRSNDLDDLIHIELARNPRMLIVDEADMLNARTLDWVRTLWDESGHRSCFVLFAKPAFYNRMQTAHARSQQDLRQVWSRLTFRRHVTGIEQQEMLQFLKARDLLAAFDEQAVAMLYQVIDGSFRELSMMVELITQMLAESPALKGRVTATLVKKAGEVRFGADMARVVRR